MHSRSQRYLDKAADFDRLAAETSHQDTKRQLSEIAREWRELASDAAHLDRMRDRDPSADGI
jgi:hypothetical protein